MTISGAQEREERQRLGRYMVISVIGLFVFWVPVLGQLLTGAGFIGIFVRNTARHRARQWAYGALSFLFVALSISALMGTLWLYGQDPAFVQNYRAQLTARIMSEQPDSQQGGMDMGTNGEDWGSFTPDDGAFVGETDDWGDVDMGGISEPMWGEDAEGEIDAPEADGQSLPMEEGTPGPFTQDTVTDDEDEVWEPSVADSEISGSLPPKLAPPNLP